MKQFLCTLLVAAVAGGAAARVHAQAPGLQLTMKDGRVTIIAREVPLRALLDEWARVGQTLIVNADKLTGPRVTLQLVDTTERDALNILLRSAAGYIAAPRPGDRPGTSAYDRITILATSSSPGLTAPVSAQRAFPNPAAARIASPVAAAIANPAAANDDSNDPAVAGSEEVAQPDPAPQETPQEQSVAPVPTPQPSMSVPPMPRGYPLYPRPPGGE